MDDDDAKIDYEENSIIVVPNCNICNHEFRPQIDEMLALGTSYKHVLEVLGSDGVGLSTKSLSNHKKNEVGYTYGFSIETIEKFREAAQTLRRAEAMANRVDWLISGDDDQEDFHRRWNEK